MLASLYASIRGFLTDAKMHKLAGIGVVLHPTADVEVKDDDLMALRLRFDVALQRAAYLAGADWTSGGVS